MAQITANHHKPQQAINPVKSRLFPYFQGISDALKYSPCGKTIYWIYGLRWHLCAKLHQIKKTPACYDRGIFISACLFYHE